MLATESDIQIDIFYMGPGNGSRKVFRCDKVGFSEEIDCANETESKRKLIEKLDGCLYEKFRSGDFTFDSIRQEKAERICGLSDGDLIEQAFQNDEFERTFTRHELMRRNLFDSDLYRLGVHGDSGTQSQAIDLLKQRAEQGQSLKR